jgi:glutamate formiminotransferase
MKIFECVPNFSEGRRREVVEAILDSIRSVPGAFILDCHSDSDHNRTVVSLAGKESAVEQAAFSAVACAAERIDMRLQRGAHPRIGAADVVPFIPLQGSTMEDGVALARRLGRRVGEELGIPVYLYAEAAASPERRSLAAIRKGEYEGLAAAVRADPARKPDFGPPNLGPAGATAIGARGPLIAYNIFLDTSNVEIAKIVAARVRASSGGLPDLQALGFSVGGHAQVSMNLTDYRRTSLRDAFSAVQNEAERLGVGILRSELVGLIPEDPARDIDPAALRLEGFSPGKILERRLAELSIE